MTTRALDSNCDWTFGRSQADYLVGDAEIRQNIKTRLLSFQNDWFLDTSANIDWLNLLGQRGTRTRIEREVERVVLATEGVVQITDLQLTVTNRDAAIILSVITAFNSEITLQLGIE